MITMMENYNKIECVTNSYKEIIFIRLFDPNRSISNISNRTSFRFCDLKS